MDKRIYDKGHSDAQNAKERDTRLSITKAV